MSKLIPMLFAGTGAAAIAAGGVFLVKNSGGSGPDAPANPNPADQTDNSPGNLLFEDVASFQSNTSGSSKCLAGYFDNLNVSAGGPESTEIDESNPGPTSFFVPSAGEANHRSCLLINWRKTTYAAPEGGNEKWNGKFTWLWSFVKGNEGFITFNVAETDADEPTKLKFTRILYLVAKDADQWKVKHRKNMDSGRKADAQNLDTYFPKTNTQLNGAPQNYWGFIGDKNKLADMCAEGSCGTGQPRSNPDIQEFIWTGDPKGPNKLAEWTDNPDWWTNLYSDSRWDLKAKAGDLPGAWTKIS